MSTDTTIDLFTLHLRVGLPVERDGKPIYYRTVKLRETSVADERWAVRQAERVVLWQGQPRLVVSDADFKLALTARHIEAFLCDSLRIDRDLIDLDLIGKLNPRDLALIEERVFLVEMSARLRFGEITQEQFDAVFAGTAQEPAAAPLSVGPADDAGAAAPGAVPGPVVLAVHAGAGADQQAAGVGR